MDEHARLETPIRNSQGELHLKTGGSSFLPLFDYSFVTADIFFANVLFPFTYTFDYLSKVVLKFLIGYSAGTFYFVYDFSFVFTRSNRYENTVLAHS